jgi:hypothetical protein
MPQRQTSRFCRTCNRRTLHARPVNSGGVGCLLTLLTFGLWLIPWLLLDVLGAARPWRCQHCGSAGASPVRAVVHVAVLLAAILTVAALVITLAAAGCTPHRPPAGTPASGGHANPLSPLTSHLSPFPSPLPGVQPSGATLPRFLRIPPAWPRRDHTHRRTATVAAACTSNATAAWPQTYTPTHAVLS